MVINDHEHHIGRRFLRRRIDGERKLAHQDRDVALSQCGMTNCRGAFQQMSMGLRSKNLQNEVMQPQEAGLDRLEIVQLTPRCQISTSIVASVTQLMQGKN